MAFHRIYTDFPLAGSPRELTISGDEARHAVRVKRLEIGDPVQVLDGRGTVADCRIAAAEKRGREWGLQLTVIGVGRVAPARPRLEVVSAAPKGTRLAELIDQLSQVGAAMWSPLESARTVVEPGAAKLERLERVAAEASKQCGRAWNLEIGPAQAFDSAIRSAGAVLADASGAQYAPSGAECIRLVIGPEGGWTEAELDAARAAACRVARFGPHTMRIETAAVAAAAIVLDAETRAAGPSAAEP